jgi:lactoylglutathione lyase
MSTAAVTTADVKQSVPFFGVTNMEASLKFYVDGLGFRMKHGDAAIMLQEFWPGRRPTETLGTGVHVCFMCEDALALYREFKSRGLQTRKRPFVGNCLWVVPVTDPDGYLIEFESPTDAPEESELEE